MDNKTNNRNDEELNPEEMEAASGGNLMGLGVRRPRRPWEKKNKPAEEPTEEPDNHGATGGW